MKKTLLLLSVLLLWTTLFWWQGGKLISGADFAFSGFSAQEDFVKNISTWNEGKFWGEGNFFNNALLPWDIFFGIFEIAHIPPIIAEMIFFAIILAAGTIGIAKLAKTVHKKNRWFPHLILFFTVNFFTVILWHNLVVFILLAYALLPWFFFFYMQALKSENRKKYILGFLLLTIAAAPAAVNPPTLLGIIVLPLFFYSLYVFLQNIKKREFRKNWLQTNFFILLLTILLHSWWLLPAWYGTKNFSLQPPLNNPSEGLIRNTEHLTIPNILNLGGHWQLYSNDLDGKPYFSFGNIYTDPSSPLSYLGILFFLAAIFGITRDANWKKPEWWMWTGLCLISLFLAKGPNPPFGEIFTFLTRHLPGFWAFRSPEYKFLPGYILGLTMLLGYTFADTEKRKKTRLAAVILFSLLAIIHAYPFFTPLLFEKENRVGDGKQRYQDFISFRNTTASTDQFYILPQQTGAYLPFTWGYQGIDFTPFILNRPSGGVRGGTLNSDTLATSINGLIFRQIEPEKVSQFLQRTGTKYVVQRNDVDQDIYPAHLLQSTPGDIKNFLKTVPDVDYQQSLGAWDVYTVQNTFPQIGMYEKATVWQGPPSTLSDILSTEKKNVTYFGVPKGEYRDISSFQNFVLKISAADTKNLVNNNGWIIKNEEYPDGLFATSEDYHKNASMEHRFSLPRYSNYKISLTIKKDEKRGTLFYKIDDGDWKEGLHPFEKDPSRKKFEPMLLAETELSEGQHTLTLKNSQPAEEQGFQEIQSFTIESLPSGEEKKTNLPSLTTEKKSPTRWSINVKDATDDYFLVFRESFHPGWKVYMKDRGKLFSKNISSGTHFIADGYANGWTVSQEGSYQLSIVFWPQRLFWMGIIITALTLAGITAVGIKNAKNKI